MPRATHRPTDHDRDRPAAESRERDRGAADRSTARPRSDEAGVSPRPSQNQARGTRGRSRTSGCRTSSRSRANNWPRPLAEVSLTSQEGMFRVRVAARDWRRSSLCSPNLGSGRPRLARPSGGSASGLPRTCSPGRESMRRARPESLLRHPRQTRPREDAAVTVEILDTERFREAQPRLHQSRAEVHFAAKRLPTLTTHERNELRGQILRHLHEHVEPRTGLDEMLLYALGGSAGRCLDELRSPSRDPTAGSRAESRARLAANDAAPVLPTTLKGLDALIRVHRSKENELLLVTLKSSPTP